MSTKAFFKKTGSFLLDLFEIYIPSVAFSIMFVVFVLQIFFRYFLNRPLTWPYEVTIFAFIWTAILGACYARREGVHVVFGLVYDKVSPKTQVIFRLIANGLIFIAFLVALKPSYEQVMFMAFKKSTVLKIPFHIAYSPYVVFVVLILGHTLYDLVIDVKKFAKGEY
ncbi:MAG: TRAP transporter small permease [bacterium]|nr:TRAP transporter small permease [bacterium]